MAGHGIVYWFAVFGYFMQYYGCQSVDYVDVAYKKPSQQTSTYQTGWSRRANDGTRSSYYEYGSCAHTRTTDGTFWFVDLLCSYPVHLVRMTNRNKAQWRLSDFDIYVSDVDPRPIRKPVETLKGELCLHHSGTLPSGSRELYCQSGPVHGRYVYVWRSAHDPLHLCDFQVLVDENLLNSEVRYRVFHGRKSTLAPSSSVTMERFSKRDCARICLSTFKGHPFVVQVEKGTKRCECILESDPQDVADQGWTLIKPYVQCTPKVGINCY